MTDRQERIVVGMDGSSASIDALKWATRQASLTGAAIEAVIGWQYPTVYDGYPLADTTDWPSNAQGILDTAIQEAVGAENTPIARTVIEGHPAQVLIDATAGADLLVVGSRGHGGFTGMLLGSVSTHVAAHAPCPVLIIRHIAGD